MCGRCKYESNLFMSEFAVPIKKKKKKKKTNTEETIETKDNDVIEDEQINLLKNQKTPEEIIFEFVHSFEKFENQINYSSYSLDYNIEVYNKPSSKENIKSFVFILKYHSTQDSDIKKKTIDTISSTLLDNIKDNCIFMINLNICELKESPALPIPIFQSAVINKLKEKTPMPEPILNDKNSNYLFLSSDRLTIINDNFPKNSIICYVRPCLDIIIPPVRWTIMFEQFLLFLRRKYKFFEKYLSFGEKISISNFSNDKTIIQVSSKEKAIKFLITNSKIPNEFLTFCTEFGLL